MPLPDAPDDREQRRVLKPADELVDETLAAEEELLVRRLERGEPLERADVAERVGRSAAPSRVSISDGS